MKMDVNTEKMGLDAQIREEKNLFSKSGGWSYRCCWDRIACCQDSCEHSLEHWGIAHDLTPYLFCTFPVNVLWTLFFECCSFVFSLNLSTKFFCQLQLETAGVYFIETSSTDPIEETLPSIVKRDDKEESEANPGAHLDVLLTEIDKKDCTDYGKYVTSVEPPEVVTTDNIAIENDKFDEIMTMGKFLSSSLMCWRRRGSGRVKNLENKVKQDFWKFGDTCQLENEVFQREAQ